MSIEVITPDIRQAAAYVADDWPGLLTASDLVADLTLILLDEDSALEVSFMHPEHRSVYLVDRARNVAAQVLADLAQYSDRAFYSVSAVRSHLKSGVLEDDDRLVWHDWVSDIQLGWKYLAKVLPRYTETLTNYLWEEASLSDEDLRAALVALTNCVNNLHRAPKRANDRL